MTPLPPDELCNGCSKAVLDTVSLLYTTALSNRFLSQLCRADPVLAELSALLWMCKVCKMAPLGRPNQGLHHKVLHFPFIFLQRASYSSRVLEQMLPHSLSLTQTDRPGRLPGSQGTVGMTALSTHSQDRDCLQCPGIADRIVILLAPLRFSS